MEKVLWNKTKLGQETDNVDAMVHRNLGMRAEVRVKLTEHTPQDTW